MAGRGGPLDRWLATTPAGEGLSVLTVLAYDWLGLAGRLGLVTTEADEEPAAEPETRQELLDLAEQMGGEVVFVD